MSSARRGFTVTEMLVILLLIGVILRVVAPRIRLTRDTYDRIEAAQQLATDLRRARAEARRRNTSIRFVRLNSGRQYGIVMTVTRTNGTTADSTLWTRWLPGTATYTPNPSTLVPQFRSFGPAYNAPTSGTATVLTGLTEFTVTVRGGTRRVTLSPSGEAEVR